MELEDIKPDKRLIKFRKAYRDQNIYYIYLES